MDSKSSVIGLVIENYKEFIDISRSLELLATKKQIYLKILDLSELYQDKKYCQAVKLISIPHETHRITSIKRSQPFSNYKSYEKLCTVVKNKKIAISFLRDCEIIISGIQTIFQRIVYASLGKDILFITYHRHLLFDDTLHRAGSYLNRWAGFMQRYIPQSIQCLFLDKKGVGFADIYLVLGEINRDYLVDNGVCKTSVSLLGSSEYKQNMINKNNVTKKTQLSICYITAAFDWIDDKEGEECQSIKIDKIIKLVERLRGFSLTIRVHPREERQKYDDFSMLYSFVSIEYPSENSIMEDLSRHDIIVGGLSTTLFESMMLEKLCIFYLLEQELDRYRKIMHHYTIRYFMSIQDVEKELLLFDKNPASDKFQEILDQQRSLVAKAIHVEKGITAIEKIADHISDAIYQKEINK